MTRSELINNMQKFNKGASFITVKQFAQFMNVSARTAQRKLRGIDKVDDRYYFIPDVAEMIIRRTL